MVDTTEHQCVDCRFYREPKSLAARLNASLADVMGDHLSSTVEGMLAEERQQQAAELQFEHECETARRKGAPVSEEWPRRPVSQPYCGATEPTGVFRMCLVKNHDLHCSKFKRPEPFAETRPCSTCRHNQLPGAGLLLARLQEIMSAFSASGAQLFVEIKQQYEVRTAQEASVVRASLGLSHTSSAFPTCRALSAPGRVVVSSALNLHDACAAHAPGAPSYPASLKELARSYAEAKTTGSTGGGLIRHDPAAIAQLSFIRGALRYLGFEAQAVRYVKQLLTEAQRDQDRGIEAIGGG